MWISVIAFWMKKGRSAWFRLSGHVSMTLCAFYHSCSPGPMLPGQGKTLWCTQRGGYKSSNPPVESSICFLIVYAHKYCPSAVPVFMKFKNVLHENVKICTLFSHFASVYWLCPWTQLGDFCPPDALAPSIYTIPDLSPVKPLHCEVLVHLWCNQSQSPSPQGSWLWLPRHTGVMWGHPMLDIARHVICTK